MKRVVVGLGLLLLVALSGEGGKGPVLLVDDDGSDGGHTDVRVFYRDALDSSGFWGQYDLWEVPHDSDGPTGADMAPYAAVIWFTGEIYGQGTAITLTSNDENNLATYLNGGGRLFLCSQDYWWDRYPGYGSFSPGEFPYDYLQARVATQDPNGGQAFTAYGDTGTVGDGMTLSVAGDSPVAQFYDQFTHAGIECFSDGTGSIGIQFNSGVYQVVWLPWPFENVIDGTPPNTKADLIYAILNWFGLTPPTDDVGIAFIGSPPPIIDPYQPVTPLATITNYGAITRYDFNVTCLIDSSGSLVYYESVPVDSIIPSQSKQMEFPESDTLGEGVSYTLTVCHDLTDQNPSNDTLSMLLSARWGCVYDDGERDGELRSDYVGCELAHCLTPPAYPYVVDSLAVYVSGYYLGVPFEVRLYEDGGGQPPSSPVGLITPITHSAQSWRWWVDNIVPHNVVIGSGDFYLVVKYLADSWGRTPVVGLDGDPPIHDRGWWANMGGPPPPYDWVPLRAMGYSANPMMRAYGHRLTGAREGQGARPQTLRARLGQNYPNPFRRATTIPYSVPDTRYQMQDARRKTPRHSGIPPEAGQGVGHITLSVYDITGRLVRTLLDGEQQPGFCTVVWDGTDESGSRAHSGVYFCRLTAGQYRTTRKLIFLK